MKLKLISSVLLFCFSTSSYAEGFMNHLSNAIQTASLDTETLLKVDELTIQCHYEVNLGLSTYETAKCKKALDLVGYN